MESSDGAVKKRLWRMTCHVKPMAVTGMGSLGAEMESEPSVVGNDTLYFAAENFEQALLKLRRLGVSLEEIVYLDATEIGELTE